MWAVFAGGSPAGHLGRQQDRATVQLTESASVLRDVLERAYGCPVIQLDDSPRAMTQSVHEVQESVHPNLLPCRVALETSQCFILVHVRTCALTNEMLKKGFVAGVANPPKSVVCHIKAGLLVFFQPTRYPVA